MHMAIAAHCVASFLSHSIAQTTVSVKLGFSVLFSAAGAKASPWGLRPQARFEAQPPKAALGAEMKQSKIFDF